MARIDAVKRGVDAEALFQDRLGQVAEQTEALLDRLLAAVPIDGERARPARLLDAMRYASLGGGKRFRPFLVVECAALFDVAREHALMAAAALECVHCYSLVHDDLPAMDNDDLRRGRPTAHKAFDEATAILAGDGLLTFAFDILARPETHPDAEVRLALVSALARAAGLGGMVGGQMLDLAAEGRFDHAPPALDEPEVKTLQAMKTGALLRFGCVAGAILGKADAGTRTRSTATARRSARRSRSPMTCSISRAIRPRSARRPARTRPRTRPRWSACLGSRRRGAGSRPWSPRRRRRWPVRQRCRRAQSGGPLRRHAQRLGRSPAHVPEKWKPVFRKDMRSSTRLREGWYSWVASNHRPPVPQTGALTI